MKVLFDHGTPAPLRRYLPSHTIDTAASKGWEHLTNGELLNAAEAAGYETLITTDQNIRHQQNMRGRNIHVIALMIGRWPAIREQTDLIREALDRAEPGTVTEIYFAETFKLKEDL